MELEFFGVRGTSPVTGAAFSRYGGDTTSVLVSGGKKEKIIIDAGTGIRRLGLSKEEKGGDEILILMTHYHLDHVMGLPSFGPIYQPGRRITIASPVRRQRTPREVLEKIFSNPFWPLPIDDLPAKLDFLTLDGDSAVEPFRFKDLEVRWTVLHHPGSSTAYRIDEPASKTSLVFATDVEWAASSKDEKKRFIDLCRNPAPPTILVFDGQYGDEEYEKFRGWGHSTRRMALEAAEQVSAGRLLITHHDPLNDDNALDRIAEELDGSSPPAGLAAAGLQVKISSK